MDTLEASSAQVLGRLSAFLTRIYESALKEEASLIRQLHSVQTSRSETAKEQIPQLESLLVAREAIVTVLELILQKQLKEERLARMPEELRDYFEAQFLSPEGKAYAA